MLLASTMISIESLGGILIIGGCGQDLLPSKVSWRGDS